MSTITSPQDISTAGRPAAAEAGRAKQGLALCAWRRFVEAVASFFFSAGAQQNDDHLVEVVRRDPVAASRVIQSIAIFSIVGNLVVGLACAIFVLLYWSRCGNCERPLRWWLLVQAALQVSQLPVRCVLLLSVRHAAAAGRVEACIISLTASPAWRTSKRVAFVQYAWFVLGMVWWLHVDKCPSCPGVGRLTAAVMFLSAARAVAALVTFRALFAPEVAEEGSDQAATVAATPEQITALPVLRFKPEAGAGQGEDEDCACCTICLCDFTEGVLLRRLPCGHEFHRRCVDKWLQRNKRCPLCIRAIDEDCPAWRAPSAAPAPAGAG